RGCSYDLEIFACDEIKGIYLGDDSFPLRDFYSVFCFLLESIDHLLCSTFDEKSSAVGFQDLVIDHSRRDQHCEMSFSGRHERLDRWSYLPLFCDQTKRRLFPERTSVELFGEFVWTELSRSDEEVSAHGRDSE